MDGFSNLKHALLAEQVQEQIYQFILNTPLSVGARLPNEFELGRKFGVGRSTVREAVKLLGFPWYSGSEKRFGNLCSFNHSRGPVRWD